MTIKSIFFGAFTALALSVAAVTAPVYAQDDGAAMVDTKAGAEVLYSGDWTKKSFRVSGEWSIYEENGVTYVRLSDDFRTRNAPDLKIFLSPRSAGDANGRNATDGSVLVAPLTSNSGGQVYEIPAGTDLTAFESILIHCEQFSKLWSAADLIHPSA
ncbi:MAG: DM13 domain-containing protein [Pseudomonadota bacterium]